jgi:hypothetical protein
MMIVNSDRYLVMYACCMLHAACCMLWLWWNCSPWPCVAPALLRVSSVGAEPKKTRAVLCRSFDEDHHS